MFNLRIDLDHDCFSDRTRNLVIAQVLTLVSEDLKAKPTMASQTGQVTHEDGTIIAKWKIE